MRSTPTSDLGLVQLLNLAQDMLCVAGFDGYFKQVNPAWERALGWTAEELTSRPYVEFMHPADRVNGSDESWTTVDGQSVVQFENRYLCRDGSYRWLSWKSVRPGGGEGSHGSGTSRRPARSLLVRALKGRASLTAGC